MQMASYSSEDVDKMIEELPKVVFFETEEMCKWEGSWFTRTIIKPAIKFRSSFHARDDDVFLTSTMKTGTTWLKALALCIMQNHKPLDSHDILSIQNPHSVVPTVEAVNYQTAALTFDVYDDTAAPRLLHTHFPYPVLPDSIKNSKAKIVYIARNPKDTVISMWHFFNSWWRRNQEPVPLEKTVDDLCSGVHLYGPYFEHVVGYWEESKKRPHKILFIKFEDLKREPEKHVLRIAEFLGRPFGDEGEAAEVVRRCSLERLKKVEVNEKGFVFKDAPNSIFLRKGQVGDWKNYFTPEMEMKINEACRLKFEPFGLYF